MYIHLHIHEIATRQARGDEGDEGVWKRILFKWNRSNTNYNFKGSSDKWLPHIDHTYFYGGGEKFETTLLFGNIKEKTRVWTHTLRCATVHRFVLSKDLGSLTSYLFITQGASEHCCIISLFNKNKLRILYFLHNNKY